MLGSLKRRIRSRSAPEVNLMNVYSMIFTSLEFALELDAVNESLKNAVFSKPNNKFFLVGRRGFIQFLDDFRSEETLDGTELNDMRTFKLMTESRYLIPEETDSVTVQIFDIAVFGFGVLTSVIVMLQLSDIVETAHLPNAMKMMMLLTSFGFLIFSILFSMERMLWHELNVSARAVVTILILDLMSLKEMNRVRVRDKWIYLEEICGRVISHCPQGKDSNVRLVKPQNKSESNLFC